MSSVSKVTANEPARTTARAGSSTAPGIRDAAGNPSPVAQTVGSGQVTVLRDGKAFEGNWNRPAPEEPTTYTGSDGQPIPVAPGQVWIVLAP